MLPSPTEENDDGEAPLTEKTVPYSDSEEDQAEADQDGPGDLVDLAHPEPQLGHFIVSIRQGSRVRTLHLLGACHRVPGKDYREWLACGGERPPPSAYTQACRQCWPQKFQIADDEDAGSESSSDDRA